MTEIVTVINVSVNLVLLILLLVRSKKTASAYSLSGVLISLLVWAVTNYLSLTSPTKEETLFWIRIVMGVGCFFAVFIIMLANYFPYNKSFFSKKFLYGATIIYSLFGIFIAPTALVVTDINFVPNNITPEFAFPGIMVYGSLLFFAVGLFAYTTLKKYRNSRGIVRSQIYLVSTGLGVTMVFSLITNFILVILAQTSSFIVFGPTFGLVLAAFVFTAIIKHRLFDIRVLIGRIVYYGFLTLLPYSAFFFLAFVFTQIFGQIFAPIVYIIGIPIGVAFVILFNYINELLRTQVTSRLINPGYNPLETAERLSNELSVLIDLPKISTAIIDTLKKTIRPDFAATVVYSDDRHPQDRVFASDNNKKFDNLLKFKNTVTTLWSTVGKHPIVYDEIDFEVADGMYKNVPNIATELKKLMEEIGAKVILTLGDDDKIIGIYIVGMKEADTPYTTSDLEFLKSIANTGALAIERSLLYSEVQEFADTLQKKVDDATAELKTTNSELQKALTQLQEARRQERDMIDVMGHELRTPITIVRNGLLMLKKHVETTEGSDKSILKYIDMTVESTRREISLIETLLSATKLEGARMQLYFTKVDFKDVVADSIEGQKDPLSKKDLNVIYQPPNEDILVYADRTRIQEIMDNLFSNAVKYTLKGDVKIEIWSDGEFGWGRVKDTGIGISEEDLQNLGKKFFRAKQYVNEHGEKGENIVRPGGTGLGLYVVFDLIGIMGGSLYINSKIGEGTTFTFSMPLFKGQEEHQVDQTFDSTPTARKNHIYLNQQAPEPGKVMLKLRNPQNSQEKA